MAKYNGYMATIVWMDHYNCNCHNTYSLHKEQKKVIVKIFSGIKRGYREIDSSKQGQI